ncbi:MAG: hypothetical protein QW303_02015 [Nitrososphaerota archaeon]
MPIDKPTIGDWSVDFLVKFMENIREQIASMNLSFLSADQISVSDISISGNPQFNQTQTTVGAAGSASPLPANPDGYIKILDNSGTVKVIPFYKAS